MQAREHLHAGELPEALASLQEEVRKAPADSGRRIFLFELYGLLGEWEKALRQLQILHDLGSEGLLLSQVFASVIQAERLREGVFAGRQTPLIFGEPEPWMGSLVQANYLLATGQSKAARELREQALAIAPASAGTINDQRFEWLADSDSRLGPVLEVFLEGKYFWIPFTRISSIQIERPENLRDLLWISANFAWTNGGTASGFIPVRYSGTENCADSALRLSRKTEWVQREEEFFTGLGQRMLASDVADHPLLEIRRIGFENQPEPVSAGDNS